MRWAEIETRVAHTVMWCVIAFVVFGLLLGLRTEKRTPDPAACSGPRMTCADRWVRAADPYP